MVVKNATGRPVAGQTHEGVQPQQSDEPPQMEDSAGLGQTPPLYYELTKQATGLERAKCRRRAYRTHIKSVAEFNESWGAGISKGGCDEILRNHI